MLARKLYPAKLLDGGGGGGGGTQRSEYEIVTNVTLSFLTKYILKS